MGRITGNTRNTKVAAQTTKRGSRTALESEERRAVASMGRRRIMCRLGYPFIALFVALYSRPSHSTRKTRPNSRSFHGAMHLSKGHLLFRVLMRLTSFCDRQRSNGSKLSPSGIPLPRVMAMRQSRWTQCKGCTSSSVAMASIRLQVASWRSTC